MDRDLERHGERLAPAPALPLTESVLKLLRQHAHQVLDPQGQIEGPVPGCLRCQDAYYVGTLKGVGRVYAKTFIDTNAAVASPSST